jgi:hypothetical protein
LPRLPNEDSDRARWMTLVEALEHIQSVEECDSVAAQKLLKHEIGHLAIPVKWADSKPPNDKPDVSKLQRSQLVLSGPGLALSGLSLRPLLVLRSAVRATWPRTTSEAAAPPEANSSARRNSAQWQAEEKYEQWMSLVEAVEHIRVSQSCNSVEALRQLKDEIGDGMVRVQWEDSEGLKDRPTPEYLHTSQLLLIGPGFAPDSLREEYRQLLVERSAAEKLWPLSNNRRKESSQTGSATQPEMPVHRPASEDDILHAARELYQQPGKPPNLRLAEERLMAKFPGTSRDGFIRPILQRDEFAGLRLPRGNQRKT